MQASDVRLAWVLLCMDFLFPYCYFSRSFFNEPTKKITMLRFLCFLKSILFLIDSTTYFIPSDFNNIKLVNDSNLPQMHSDTCIITLICFFVSVYKANKNDWQSSALWSNCSLSLTVFISLSQINLLDSFFGATSRWDERQYFPLSFVFHICTYIY